MAYHGIDFDNIDNNDLLGEYLIHTPTQNNINKTIMWFYIIYPGQPQVCDDCRKQCLIIHCSDLNINNIQTDYSKHYVKWLDKLCTCPKKSNYNIHRNCQKCLNNYSRKYHINYVITHDDTTFELIIINPDVVKSIRSKINLDSIVLVDDWFNSDLDFFIRTTLNCGGNHNQSVKSNNIEHEFNLPFLIIKSKID